MRRRDLLLGIGATLAGAASPLRLRAQQVPRLPLVGIFGGDVTAELDGFYHGMRELGYVAGKDVTYVRHSPQGPPEQRVQAARDLAGLKPAVIVTGGGLPSLRALQTADGAVPIVAAVVPDLVENGIAAGLAHPGGHVTGLSVQSVELAAKRLEVLHDAFPQLRRVALFIEASADRATVAAMGRLTIAVQKAAQSLGVRLEVVELAGPASFEKAFAAANAARAEAVINSGGRIISPNREKFLALAAQHRLPTMCHQSTLSRSGCLMSYGPSFPDLWRRAAGYVDKILKGAKPADLPVEQPTRFELVINLKTARALGLTVPQSLLARADEVIE